MKLCPQCEFIYEDDQRRCDMDGELLVYDTRGVLSLDSSSPVLTGAKPRPRRRIIALPVVAGLVLSALLFIAYCASSPQRYSRVAAPAGKSEAMETTQQHQLGHPPANSASQSANPTQSPDISQAASEAKDTRDAEESTERRASEFAKNQRLPQGIEETAKAGDKRLTIARALPPLPHLTPLPQLPPPRRLPLARPELKVTGSNQKALVVDVLPGSGIGSKGSRVSRLTRKR